MKKILLIMVLTTLVFTLSACGRDNTRLYHNPYEHVDWDNTTTILAALHNHTTNSDGDLMPHEVVDLFHGLGFGALAITDHEDDRLKHPPITYPWDGFSDINPDWEDRDPDALGMLDIPGSEFSRVHHMTGLFTDLYLEAGYDVEAILAAIAEEELATVHFAHPGRYWNWLTDYEQGELYSPAWYIDFFERYDEETLLGIEVFSRNDFYEHDRYLWDILLTELMPERTVWGLGVDDHHGSYAKWSFTQHPMLDTMDKDEFRQTLIDGAFFAVNIRQEGHEYPEITRISVDEDARTITIEANNYDTIRWISGYDTVLKQSTVVGEGETFYYGDLDAPYVRAEVILADGSVFRRKVITQPFGLIQDD